MLAENKLFKSQTEDSSLSLWRLRKSQDHWIPFLSIIGSRHADVRKSMNRICIVESFLRCRIVTQHGLIVLIRGKACSVCIERASQ